MDDMEAGRRAGSATALLRNDGNREVAEHGSTDCVVWSLAELVDVLKRGFEELDRAIIVCLMRGWQRGTWVIRCCRGCVEKEGLLAI